MSHEANATLMLAGSKPSSHAPTLLVTSTRPGKGSVGEIFLAALCKLFQPGELFCFAGVSPSYEVPVLDPELEWLPIKVVPLPPEYHWQYKERLIQRWLRNHRHLDLLERSLEPLVQETARMIAENQIERLWLVLNSPSMLIVAQKILERFDIPAVAIVWDPMHSITEQGKMDQRSRKILDQRFEEVIFKLRAAGVASAGMQEYFAEKRPDLPTRTLIYTPRSRLLPAAAKKDPSKIVITFAGSLYAESEFLALVAALNNLGWTMDGRSIELRVFSTSFYHPIYSANKRTNLVFGGYLDENELATELANSDVAYLPYWFAKEYSEAVRRCFPAKFATYIASGCPVLFHGPKTSSPAVFLSKFKVGAAAHSSDPAVIEKALRYLLNDEEFRNSYQAERERALAEELGAEIFAARFLELLELSCKTK